MANKGEKNPNAVLKYIQDNFIKMDGNDVKQSNVIIEKFIRPVLMKAMCDSDDLFKVLYSKLYYTGSFYDGLRVDKPHEFDLDFVMDISLPKDAYSVSIASTISVFLLLNSFTSLNSSLEMEVVHLDMYYCK